MTEPLLFPLGQYLGPFHPGPGLPARQHQLRLGWDHHVLDADRELDVWVLTHGHPAVVGVRPVTRRVVEAVAADAGLPVADPWIDRLIERGLVAEVHPGTDGAVRFAREHRLYSLLTGLGDARPGTAGIGLLGSPPVREVSPEVFEYWAWAHLFPDLHSAATGLAEMAAGVDGTPAVSPDPAVALDGLIGSLHELLCVDAGFLDVVRRPR